ncbi:sugar-binding transcriptional regulator [Paeniglutamicibacter sp. Y32M11]|uniref:sugar-binding transcriptional regulator n=1 Tax=Paeniglutamicibacter sp. Y32M11 TaxID=2853258 RepID=UPI00351D6B4A
MPNMPLNTAPTSPGTGAFVQHVTSATPPRGTRGTPGHGQPRERDALRAAQLYYLQDLTMESIAKELAVSRSTVSRLLSMARRTGLVNIEINAGGDRSPVLVRELEHKFGIKVHVVPTDGALADAEILERVATHAAHVLNTLVSSGMTVGVAWGSTMQALSLALMRKPTHDTLIVQLNGAANPQTTGLTYASEILQRFGAAYTARVEQFPVPAFFDQASTREAMWREGSVRRVLGVQQGMGLAVFSLGATEAAVPSQVYRGGYLSPAESAALHEHGVVGDVATVFFDGSGSDEGIEINSRATGPTLRALRKVPRRLCVLSGAGKLRALHGALAGGLITDLVLDEGTALRLLNAPPSSSH